MNRSDLPMPTAFPSVEARRCNVIGPAIFAHAPTELGALPKRVLSAPVLTRFSDTRVEFDVQVVRYGHVAAVEQRVKVGPEEQPIRNEVRIAFGVRANVRRL